MAASMVDRWTELPKDILDLITKWLELEDLIRLSCVCHTWKSFASSLLPSNHNLWLIVPQKDSNNGNATTYGQNLCFFNLANRRVYKIETPAIADRRICGSCQGGWLITVHEKGEIQMFHPFSKVVIDLPPITKLPGVAGSFIDQDGDLVYNIPTSTGKVVHRENIIASDICNFYIYKVITSSSNRSTCIVMAIQGLYRVLAFCRPGKHKRWRLVKGGDGVRFADVTYFKGKFYAVNNSGKVFVVDGLDGDSPSLKLFIDSARSFGMGKYYLVDSLGELLLVWKMTYAPLDFEEMMEEAMEENYPSYKTENFTVHKLDFNGPRWVDIHEIDRALFVGYNHSFSISTLDLVGCKKNSIYFTDDNIDEYTNQPFGGHDLGVFNLWYGGIERLYPSDSKFLIKPPPVWYTTMSASVVHRWAELPEHLFHLITKRLELEDLIRVSCVCHTWKSFASSLLPPNRNLWLIVPQNDPTNDKDTTYGQTLGLYNLSNRRVYKIETAAIADRRICGSCQGGWLITVHEKGEIQMLHPFSKVLIDLPPITKLPGVAGSFIDQDGDLVYNIPTSIGKEVSRENIIASCIRDIYIYKVITSSANVNTSIVMAIQGLFRSLAFCRPGMDKKWRLIRRNDSIRFADVTYFKGKFYAVNNSGQVFVVDGLESDSPCLKLFIDSAHSYCMGKYYLVESLGELLLVWKMTYAPSGFEEMMEEAMEENYPSYKTRNFTVCKLNFNGPKWVDIREIDRALFVGYNHSFSISTSELAGCKSNSIYFTDDNMDEYTNQPFGGHDFGVFDMRYGGIRRLNLSDSKFLFKPPPVWYTTMPISMVDRWTELPKCIFDMIIKRLELEDVIRASCVCHTWKSSLSSLLPANSNIWLIVPQEGCPNSEATTYGQTLGLFSLSDHKIYKIQIPAIANRRICGSCRGGWLVTVHEKGEIQILHPFSKVVVDLPPITKLPGVGGSFIDQDGDLVYNIPTSTGKRVQRKNVIASCIRDIYIYKVIMSSSNPSTCIVMAIQGLFRSLAFCRPGTDNKWRLVKGSADIRFADVTYFKGKFYAVNNSGKVFIVDGLDGDSPCLKLFINSAHSYGMGKCYLVDTLGELLFVWKMTYAPPDFEEMIEEAMEENYPSYKTSNFTVCKLDFNGRKWVDITEIDRALFLGYNHSFSVSTSDFAGCKSNAIYFTDDNMDEYTNQPFGGHDLGVFDLSYGDVEKLYPCESKLIKPPPLWLTTISC